MKLLAISQRVDQFTDINEKRDGLDQRIFNFLLTADILPIPVPNFHDRPDVLSAWLDRITPDGIILSGGNDLGKMVERDKTEVALLVWAEKHMKPVLGICRGMQMLAAYAGVSVTPTECHVRTKHPVSGVINKTVNSYHEFRIADCPQDYKILAISEDGVIEAIRHKNIPWEGWMWHPERDFPFDHSDVKRLKDLLA